MSSKLKIMMLRVLTGIPSRATLLGVNSIRCSLHVSSCELNFWEPDKKGGYVTNKELPTKEHVKQGLKLMKSELSKFKEEAKCTLRCDSVAPLQHGDYEVVWKFDSQSAVNDWIVTSDKDHNEGQSTAQFILGSNKNGIFKGHLDTTVPKDGIIKSSGYCNIRSPSNMISFKRSRPYDWELFTHLVMKVRGDGRSYHLVLNMDRTFDIQWNDQYNYPLFTRGGPYWQIAKIPFSKFYLSAKGRIQDKQEALQASQIRCLGITLADSNPGPFQLEIAYIAVLYDSNHPHTFEYEMYPVSPSVFC